MKKKKDNSKIKFPVQIQGDTNLPDVEFPDTFTISEPKPKLSSEINEITTKKKKKKCQSKPLM